jgi:hypothetical protein
VCRWHHSCHALSYALGHHLQATACHAPAQPTPQIADEELSTYGGDGTRRGLLGSVDGALAKLEAALVDGNLEAAAKHSKQESGSRLLSEWKIEPVRKALEKFFKRRTRFDLRELEFQYAEYRRCAAAAPELHRVRMEAKGDKCVNAVMKRADELELCYCDGLPNPEHGCRRDATSAAVRHYRARWDAVPEHARSALERRCTAMRVSYEDGEPLPEQGDTPRPAKRQRRGSGLA